MDCRAARQKAEAALKDHAVDAVVAPESCATRRCECCSIAIDGKFDWKARRAQKKAARSSSTWSSSMMTFETAKGFIAGQAGKLPGAGRGGQGDAEGCAQDRATTRSRSKAKHFAKVAKTPQATR